MGVFSVELDCLDGLLILDGPDVDEMLVFGWFFGDHITNIINSFGPTIDKIIKYVTLLFAREDLRGMELIGVHSLHLVTIVPLGK